MLSKISTLKLTEAKNIYKNSVEDMFSLDVI